MEYMRLPPEQREQLLASLEAMSEFLERAFGSLDSERARARPAAESFSPVEQVWHLADLEREAFAVRIDRLLHEVDPELPDFDGGRMAAERDYRSRSIADGLSAFMHARAANLRALRGVTEPSWHRAGTQEGVGRVALCDIPAFMAQHDAAHRAEIEAWRSSTP
jgi:hypothetical protein